MLPPAVAAAWTQLLRVGRTLLPGVEADLQKAGFPPLVWQDTLVELRRAGEGGVRPQVLQDRLQLPQYALSRLIDRMEREGWVVRLPCPGDARGQVLLATADGLALLDRMWPAYRAAIKARFADRLDSASAEILGRLLGKLL